MQSRCLCRICENNSGLQMNCSIRKVSSPLLITSSFSLFHPVVNFSTMPPLNSHSRLITQPKSQGASQAMLMATGLSWSDLDKAQVGICSVWYEGNPCNMHLLDLGKRVKKSIAATNELVGFQFNTVGVSDGISMGTPGMSFSLPSREIIADSIETVVSQILWSFVDH